ncbi:ABC transporter substrate-binding protein [Micromonospora sp. NBC_01813]|uniref:ABC transporter substrate-binding protein n=1 Tax=Micromonospora sp. NBC_01813 TaxID=2975988 RepID=UPI002DD880C5|nr:extracellular solute-binding protein [Micromonospora sp. NBC_01813]WSA08983.1 extracellular solute-binding protein [Micromonospora sp. NBC_01813]
MRRTTSTLRIVAPLTALSLVLAACGGDDADAAATALPEELAVASTVDMTDEEYAEYLTKLAEASEAEGGVLKYYFSAPAAAAENQINAFIEKYPWVELEYTSGGTLELIERIITENAAGRPSADVIQGGPLEDNTLCRDEGLCLAYNPRGEGGLPADRAYPDCVCSVADFFTFHIVYNNDKVTEAEAPKTYEDLTDPKWKGRFGINIDQLDWFAGMLAERGEEPGLALMEAIAANEPVVYSGADGLEKLAAGEFDVALPQTATRTIRDMIADGAPIDIVTTPVTIAQPDMYFPLANAPHPATTRLYMEWLMSDDWQDKVGELVVKIPIKPGSPIPSSAEGILESELFFETTDNFGDYDTRVEQHQSIFVTG